MCGLDPPPPASAAATGPRWHDITWGEAISRDYLWNSLVSDRPVITCNLLIVTFLLLLSKRVVDPAHRFRCGGCVQINFRVKRQRYFFCF
jgi:hypothetical protein